MRFTPAGIEVFEAVLHHRSEVVEAGKVRKLEFDFNAVSYGALARIESKEPPKKQSLKEVLQDKANEKKAQRTVPAQTKHKQQDMEL